MVANAGGTAAYTSADDGSPSWTLAPNNKASKSPLARRASPIRPTIFKSSPTKTRNAAKLVRATAGHTAAPPTRRRHTVRRACTPHPPTLTLVCRRQQFSPMDTEESQVFSDPESPTDRSDCASPEAGSSSAGDDATLLMLLLEASTAEMDPKADELEPVTPVDSLLPPHASTGFQAPTPGTRNHTQELLSGRGGANAAAGMPSRASWTSPSPVVGRGGTPTRHYPAPLCSVLLLRAPCF